jgi:Cd2+/Zn2+-exporting ATPase
LNNKQSNSPGFRFKKELMLMESKQDPVENVIPVHQEEGTVYLIQGMDCSACAVTIQKHLSSIVSVKSVHVNFSTGKMKIQHELTDADIAKEVKKIGYRATRESSMNRNAEPEKVNKSSLSTVLAAALLAIGFAGSFTMVSSTLITLLYAASMLIGGYRPAKSAFYAIRNKSLDMNVLMTAAAVGAALLGEWLEGATVVWLFTLGVTLQNKSIDRTRNSIRSLMDLAPAEAWVKSVDNHLVRTSLYELPIGTIIIVKPGEKIPLDGRVVSGESSVNQAPITGESLPVKKENGDPVYAGTINETGTLDVQVTKRAEDSTLARIIHLVEEAQEKKAPSQEFVDRFARRYTPIVFVLALLTMSLPPLLNLGTWSEWIYRGLELLVVACPCALVISTPVAIVSAIGNAARNGVLIKGGSALEKAASLNAIAFDKTGTLTEGRPSVVFIQTYKGTEQNLIALALTIEERSNHPIAVAITQYAADKSISAFPAAGYESLVGKGAKAVIDSVPYFTGNAKLFEEKGISLHPFQNDLTKLQNEGKTIVIVGTEQQVIGLIGVSDSLRTTTTQTLKALKGVGIRQLVMLTGDNQGTARKMAQDSGVDSYQSELLPEDKVQAIQSMKDQGSRVAMIGDGINDAPALATADLGIAMGGAGTDTAIETADIVLMADHIEKLPFTIRLSRSTLNVIRQNIWFSLIIKFTALILIFPGWLTLWIAVLSDTGAALIVILNSMRLLRKQ